MGGIHGPINLGPCIDSKVKFWNYLLSYFTVAIATVNRSVTAWLKGYFGVFATLGTYCGEHLASGTVAAVSVTF